VPEAGLDNVRSGVVLLKSRMGGNRFLTLDWLVDGSLGAVNSADRSVARGEIHQRDTASKKMVLTG
jgi:hypothetical protein